MTYRGWEVISGSFLDLALHHAHGLGLGKDV